MEKDLSMLNDKIYDKFTGVEWKDSNEEYLISTGAFPSLKDWDRKYLIVMRENTEYKYLNVKCLLAPTGIMFAEFIHKLGNSFLSLEVSRIKDRIARIEQMLTLDNHNF